MIKIKILGCPKKDRRDNIRAIIQFFLNELIPRKRRISITLVIEKGFKKETGNIGCCAAEDWPTSRCHHEFTIKIDAGASYADLISTLAHEMTHVKQFATGQLLYDRRDPTISIWEGWIYHENAVKYEEEPWEIDAVAHEKTLIKALIETDLWRS